MEYDANQFFNSITDAFNETKDKVKYLDSLKRYFEQLYLPNITVSTLSNSVLPGLMATVRQMDAISRYYARTGYLGVLFTKVGSRPCISLKSIDGNGVKICRRT
jgi:dynein heavy chain